MSNKLMNALKSCPIDLNISVGLNTVCIDNEGIRSQILKANKIEISTVPCVLIVYSTGGVEKYEGENAFQWINETVSKFMPPHQNQPEQIPQKQVPRKIISRPVSKREEEEEEEEEEEPIQKPLRKVKFEQQKNLKKETTMEELGIEPDTQESVHQSQFETYDNSERLEEKELKKQGSVKGKDLMATAMAMQKERDSVESNKPRTNGDIVTNKRPI
jgi:hypothetical protein